MRSLAAFTLGAVATSLGLSSFGQQLPQGTPSAQSVTTVHIHINTAYDDSDSSLTFISHLIDALPPRVEEMSADESLSRFIFRIYGVSTYDRSSPSYLPKTYDLLEQRVLHLNGATDAAHLKAGPIRCPQLPKKAWTYFNASLPQNSVPSIAKFDALKPHLRELSELSVDDVTSVRSSAVLFEKPNGAQTADLEVALTPALGRQFLNDPVLSRSSTALSFPFTATLADATTTTDTDNHDHTVLSQADSIVIRGLMTTRSQRDVPLFILDTGWPTRDEYLASRTQLKSILALIWQKRLSPAVIPNMSDPPFERPPSNPHSDVVRRALQEFEGLDPNHHVKVVYIPLTQEQGAQDLLDILLVTSYLLMYQAEHPGAPIEKKVLQTAKQNADGVVGSLQKTWVGESINTDKALLDAVLWVGTAWADLKQTGFVVNESWTVPHNQYFVNYIEPPEGIVTAAVGNLGQNINSARSEVDFSQRCSTTLDTLAVMNLRPQDGSLCCSSMIDEQNVPTAMAAGFDGEVSGTDCASLCGTSFAAPRVAWIIAAGESLRSSAFDSSRWGLNVRSRIFSARQSGVQGFQATWLDTVRYLSLSLTQ